jgi:hypothetical protein
MFTETKTPAKDEAEIASTSSAKTEQRKKRVICIILLIRTSGIRETFAYMAELKLDLRVLLFSAEPICCWTIPLCI